MRELTSSEFETEVLQSDIPVVVDFFATWCMPCKMIAPVLDELSTELEGKVKILKVDIEKCEDVTNRYNIKTVPTLLVVSDGNVVEQMVGALPKSQMLEKLEPFM